GVRADAAGRVADTGFVALIEGRADDGVRPDAGAGLAGVRLGAGIARREERRVGLVGGGAEAAGRVADTGVVALVEGRADDEVRPDACAGLAGVRLGAGVAVRASGAVRLFGVGADAAGRVADTGVVALIEGRADDEVRPDAGAGLAGVRLGAGIAVRADGAVRLVRVRADA